MVDSHFYSGGKKFDTLEEASRQRDEGIKKAMEVVLSDDATFLDPCKLKDRAESREVSKPIGKISPEKYRRIILPEDDET